MAHHTNYVWAEFPQNWEIVASKSSPPYRLESAISESQTDEKLESFADLQVGWHYRKGSPISRSVLENAKLINRYLFKLGFSKTDAFPGVEGQVLLTAYNRDHIVEITIYPPGNIATFVHEKNDEEISAAERIDLLKAVDLAKEASKVIDEDRSSDTPIALFGT